VPSHSTIIDPSLVGVIMVVMVADGHPGGRMRWYAGTLARWSGYSLAATPPHTSIVAPASTESSWHAWRTVR